MYRLNVIPSVEDTIVIRVQGKHDQVLFKIINCSSHNHNQKNVARSLENNKIV